MTKVALFLMTKKGYAVLDALIKAGFTDQIIGVVFAKDKNVQNDYHKEILDLCIRHAINIYERKEAPTFENTIKLAIGWRWIIKETINLIVIHDSLLPKYRGFAPLVSSLINGETNIGATMLIASDDYDKGDIIFQQNTSITYPIKIEQAIEKISQIYINLTITLFKYISENLIFKYQKQDEALASYSLWRDENDYWIDWQLSSVKIKRFVDAVGFPYSGAKSNIDGEEIRIWDVEIVDDVIIENRTPGKIIFKDGTAPVIVCGYGLIKITKATTHAGVDFAFNSFRARLLSQY